MAGVLLLSTAFLSAQVFVNCLLVAFGRAGCSSGVARLLIVITGRPAAPALFLLVALFLI